MFRKLRDKISEEVQQTSLRLPVSVQQLSQLSPFGTTDGNSSEPSHSPQSGLQDDLMVDISGIEPAGDNKNLFSIDEESTEGSPTKSSEFQVIELCDDQLEKSTDQVLGLKNETHSVMEEPFDPTANASLPPSRRSQRRRRSSDGSTVSEVGGLFPIYEVPGVSYTIPQQSDLESCSEFEDTSNGLDRLSKDTVYQAYLKMRQRYHKYKGRYADTVRAYQEKEKETEKLRDVLAKTQDKAMRRVSELREQCSLEQQAKAHLEQELRSDLEEKDHKINALLTKVRLLQENFMSDGSIKVCTVVLPEGKQGENIENQMREKGEEKDKFVDEEEEREREKDRRHSEVKSVGEVSKVSADEPLVPTSAIFTTATHKCDEQDDVSVTSIGSTSTAPLSLEGEELVEKLKGELAKHKSLLKRCMENITANKDKLASLTQERDIATAQLQDKIKYIDGVKAEHERELDSLRASVESSALSMAETKKQLFEELQTKEREVDMYKEKIEELATRIRNMEEEEAKRQKEQQVVAKKHEEEEEKISCEKDETENVNQLTVELKKLQEIKELLEEELIQLKTSNQEFAKENSELENSLELSNNEVEEMMRRIKDVEDKNETLLIDKQKSEKNCSSLIAENEQLQELNKEFEVVKSKNDLLQTEFNAKKNELLQIIERCDNFEKEILKMKHMEKENETIKQNNEKTIKSFEEKLTGIENEMECVVASKQALEKDKRDITSEISELQIQIQHYNTSNERFTNEIKKYEEENNKLIIENEKINKENNEVNKELQELKKIYEKDMKELNNKWEKVEMEYKNQLQDGKKLSENLKRELNEADNKCKELFDRNKKERHEIYQSLESVYEEKLKGLNDKYKMEMNLIEVKLKEEIRMEKEEQLKLGEKCENEIRRMKENCDKQVQMLTDKSVNEASELQDKHDEEIQELKDNHDKYMAEINGKHVFEMNDVRSENQKQKNEIEKKNEKLKEIMWKHKEKLDEIEINHKEQIKEREEKFDNDLKAIGNKEQELIAKQEEEKSELEERIEQLERKKTELKIRIDNLEKEADKIGEIKCNEIKDTEKELQNKLGLIEQKSCLIKELNIKNAELKNDIQKKCKEEENLKEAERKSQKELEIKSKEILHLKDSNLVLENTTKSLTSKSEDLKKQISELQQIKLKFSTHLQEEITLKQKEVDGYQRDINILEDSNEKLKIKCNEFEEKVELLGVENSNLKKKFYEKEKEYIKLLEEGTFLQDSLKTSKSELLELKSKLQIEVDSNLMKENAINKIHQDCKDNENNLKLKDEEISTLRQENAAFYSKLQSILKSKYELNIKYLELEKVSKKTQSVLENVQMNNCDLNSKLDSYLAKEKSLQDKYEKSLLVIKKKDDNLKHLSEEKSELRGKIAEFEIRLTETQKEAIDGIQKERELSEKFTNLNISFTDSQTKLQDLENQNKKFGQEKLILTDKLKALEEKINTVTKEKKQILFDCNNTVDEAETALKSEKSKSKEEHKLLSNQTESLSNELTTTQQQLRDQQTKMAQTSNKCKSHLKELDVVKKEKEALGQQFKSLEKEMSELQSIHVERLRKVEEEWTARANCNLEKVQRESDERVQWVLRQGEEHTEKEKESLQRCLVQRDTTITQLRDHIDNLKEEMDEQEQQHLHRIEELELELANSQRELNTQVEGRECTVDSSSTANSMRQDASIDDTVSNNSSNSFATVTCCGQNSCDCEQLRCRIDNLERQNGVTSKLVAMLEFNNQHNKTKVSNMELSNNDLKRKIEKLQNEIVSLELSAKQGTSDVEERLRVEKEELRAQLQQEIDTMKEGKQNVQEENNALQEVQKENLKQIAEIEDNNSQLHLRLSAAQEDTEVAKRSSAAAEDKVLQVNKQMTDILQEKEVLNTFLQHLQQQKNSMEAELVESKSKISEMMTEKDTLAKNITNLQKQLECLNETNTQLSKDLDDSKQACSNTQLGISAIKEENASLLLTNAELSSNLLTVQEQNHCLSDNLIASTENLQSKINSLESDLENERKEKQQLTSEVDERKQKLEEISLELQTTKAEMESVNIKLNKWTTEVEEKTRVNGLQCSTQESINIESVDYLNTERDELEKAWQCKLKSRVVDIEKEYEERIQALTSEWNTERKELERLTQVAAAAFRSGTDSVDLLKKQVTSQRMELEEAKKKHNKEVGELRALLDLLRRGRDRESKAVVAMPLEEAAEFEYLKNILYQYMMGKETQTLSKVLCAVLKFDQVQQKLIEEHEEKKLNLIIEDSSSPSVITKES